MKPMVSAQHDAQVFEVLEQVFADLQVYARCHPKTWEARVTKDSDPPGKTHVLTPWQMFMCQSIV